MSKFNTIVFTQKIPVGMEIAWDFFSSPANLAKITPTYMGFEVTSTFQNSQKMYPGQIITYKVSPLLGLKMNWMTEITHVAENSFFVDEQRFGPYALWHHQHHFKEIEGGIEMTDIIDYVLPLGILGVFANYLFVKKQLNQIFEHRFKVVEQLFGKF
ncbi:MAG: SRPBCC family protein [Bacteroidota bacterium]